MSKNLIPDFSRDGELCRYEIYISIPRQKTESFLQHYIDLIEELKTMFGVIPVTYIYEENTGAESTSDRRHMAFFAKHNLECENFFAKRVPVWKQQFGREFIVLRSNVDNLVYNSK